MSRILFLLLAGVVTIAAQQAVPPAPPVAPAGPDGAKSQAPPGYVLGPDDQISIWAAEAPEISAKPATLDPNGDIKLPLVGTVHAGGLTVRQLEAALKDLLGRYILRPEVAVTITEFRSQPVSVIGAVNNPGIHQLRGQKTVVEVLSLAGGIKDDAGHTVKITRRLEWGRIPLSNATNDLSGGFSVAEISLEAIMGATNPVENIIVRPYDILSVPRAEMVYVIGEVVKAGGFVLKERENISVLQALALAGGLARTASPQNAKVLRTERPNVNRVEIAVDIKRILVGKAKDMPLRSDDILFIPSSGSKKAAARVAEAALQTATGIVIWRGARFR